MCVRARASWCMYLCVSWKTNGFIVSRAKTLQQRTSQTWHCLRGSWRRDAERPLELTQMIAPAASAASAASAPADPSVHGTRLARLLFLCGLVVVCHTVTSYLEEVLFKRLAFKSAFFMVLVMCAIFVAGFLFARLAWIGSDRL